MKTPKTRAEAAKACITIMDTDFFRALCEPARIQIFRQLVLKGRADIGTIAKALPQDRSVIARHLQTMQRAGLLSAETEGRHTFYQINGTDITARLEQMVSLMHTLVPLCCPPK